MIDTSNIIVLCILISIFIALLILLKYVTSQKRKKQLQKISASTLVLILIWLFAAIMRISFNIELKYFYDVVFIAVAFLPVLFYFMSVVFSTGKIGFKRIYAILFVIPFVTLILAWTNDFHHLLFTDCSSIESLTFGPYFYVHAIYSNSLYILSFYILLRYSIRNSGFFSKQAMLIFVGALIPTITDAIETFKIFSISEYSSLISFAFSAIFISFAFFKFSFLKVSPIALQKIVDRMSDAYIVIDNEYKIIDFNQTFVKTTRVNQNVLRNMDAFTLLVKSSDLGFTKEELEKALETVTSDSSKTVAVEKDSKKLNKYFNVEISSISSKDSIIGILILFKDITQHVRDIKTIKNSQDLLVERERLASLGQMIGGIAHNLKTPIMSIAGAAEGLSDLIQEYDSSIDDPQVTHQDHHDIAKDMQVWVDKVRDYTSYMSDVITVVKGQAVTLSDDQATKFNVEELVKRVNILMKHELKNALVELSVGMNVDPGTELEGNINSLVQVINNMISNAIQCYGGKSGNKIEMNFYGKNSELIIEIRDYGPGLPKEVKDKLFKEMITTKGKNGTGLGLFMSYSNIRAHFNGNITFESEEGKGTAFFIHLPIAG